MLEHRGQGVLLILSAPSGGGKSTLANRLRSERADVEISISHTTRSIRGEEEDGVHYHFVTEEVFKERANKGAFAEHAIVYGNYYGTSREVVDGILARGHHVILDIDIQGGEQLMDTYPDAVSVFVVPPSLEALEQRLIARSTDSEASMQLRLASARQEVQASSRYQYVLINDDLDQAVKQLHEILNTETLRRHRMEHVLRPYLNAPIAEEK